MSVGWRRGPSSSLAGVVIGSADRAVRRRRLIGRHAVACSPWGTRSPRGGLSASRHDPGGARSGGTLHPAEARPGLAPPGGRSSGPFRPPSMGALLSDLIGGRALLIVSGLVLIVVGQRVLRPIDPSARAAGGVRRKNRLLLISASAGVGLFAGLLANGGGFLLVPMYLLVFGLTDARVGRHEPARHLHHGHPHLGHALGARSHRLGGGRRLRPRRRSLQLREPVDLAQPRHRDPVSVTPRLVPHRLGDRLRAFTGFLQSHVDLWTRATHIVRTVDPPTSGIVPFIRRSDPSIDCPLAPSEEHGRVEGSDGHDDPLLLTVCPESV